MNMYQKIAFSVAGLLAFAFVVAWTTQLNGLGFVLVLAFVVALLTLPLTWKLIIGALKVAGLAISLIGHTSGYAGDWLIGRSNTALEALSSTTPRFAQPAPDWNSSDLQPVQHSVLDRTSFVDGAMDRQNS